MHEVMATLLDIADRNVELKERDSLKQPGDFSFQAPENTLPDWPPEIPFRQTMADVLNYWRERLAYEVLHYHAPVHAARAAVAHDEGLPRYYLRLYAARLARAGQS